MDETCFSDISNVVPKTSKMPASTRNTPTKNTGESAVPLAESLLKAATQAQSNGCGVSLTVVGDKKLPKAPKVIAPLNPGRKSLAPMPSGSVMVRPLSGASSTARSADSSSSEGELSEEEEEEPVVAGAEEFSFTSLQTGQRGARLTRAYRGLSGAASHHLRNCYDFLVALPEKLSLVNSKGAAEMENLYGSFRNLAAVSKATKTDVKMVMGKDEIYRNCSHLLGVGDVRRSQFCLKGHTFFQPPPVDAIVPVLPGKDRRAALQRAVGDGLQTLTTA